MSKKIQKVNISCNEILEFSWSGCPESLMYLDLSSNELSLFSWIGCPRNLQEMYLNENPLLEYKWYGYPTSLQVLNLSDNDHLKKFTWDGYYSGLFGRKKMIRHVDISNTNATLSWENCPTGLQLFYVSNRSKYDYAEYLACLTIQRAFRNARNI
jgi:Leucine-rich repeat (LRR) protein